MIQLRLLPGLTDERLLSLLRCYDPKSILENAGPHELGQRAWRERGARVVQERLDRALRMVEDLEVSVLCVRDEAYPQRARLLDAFAPPILFCRGRTELFDTRGIAVIGARDSTEYGDSVAQMLATDLARRSVTIISGLARGIDTVAHRNALQAGGATIAVLGCGIDVPYPPSNARLQERIAEEGLLMSEFPPGTPAQRQNFPKRNRLIALLGSGVLVVEAGLQSGTRKTVEWALTYGLPVFAVPGPIGRHESEGTNEIIQDGGHLVTSTRDILEPLGWSGLRAAEGADEDASPPLLDAALAAVYARVDATGLHVDEIARRCGLSASDALSSLIHLELDGLVVQHAGKRFSRVLPRAGRPTPQPRNRNPLRG